MILFGIKNCDTVKKARKHLDNSSTPYQFHDFREAGLDEATLDGWLEKVEWQTLLNTRSTSWRQLSDEQKSDVDQEKAKALMLDNPTLVKRPVLDSGDRVTVGYKAADYDALVAAND
ncbi:ArsC family reductase [Ferrimonas sediminicola]|uniref:ArsC family reductase n=1 Tax=Ferrimonas sediminicola TaxID=2569538 RepID=A0A4U1BH36_9GAMM|nr:ArsC family reductase [Ferrimonas sediminicola]TKB50672.1 ArsC family reductase [Ferrimonas sediminicola]